VIIEAVVLDTTSKLCLHEPCFPRRRVSDSLRPRSVDTVQSGHFAEEMIKSEKAVSFGSQSERRAEERRHGSLHEVTLPFPASKYS
jgi:hypothetical protein